MIRAALYRLLNWLLGTCRTCGQPTLRTASDGVRECRHCGAEDTR